MNQYLMLGIIVAIVLYVISIYNKAISLRNYVQEAFSTMDIYLKKRWDLIPNIVEVVKGYAVHEEKIFLRVTELRNKNYSTMSTEEKLNANKQLNPAIQSLLAVVENYPDLKANENFNTLMNQLSAIENDIANSRRYYNGTVREFNTLLEVFPSNIICGHFNLKQEKLFEIEDSERNNVKVEF